MRVVLLTNADSLYCKKYVEHVLIGKYDVLIISTCNKKYRRYYKENGVEVLIWAPEPTFAGRMMDRIADKIHRDDIFHVHYVEPERLKYLWKPWLKCKKRILTYWGSDLLRLPLKQIHSVNLFIYTADEIVIMNDDMHQKMKKIVSKVKWNCIKCLNFGNLMFDAIEKVSNQMSAYECKQYFELPTDKIIVSVGYNAAREQQHLEMMQEVVKLPKEILSKMYFVFHFGYIPREEGYLNQLYKLLEENNVQYKVIKKFFEEREIAILRLGTDIFLYGQMSDALSASTLEYMYAGAVLIKPTWLDYSDIKGLLYYEYEQFEGINDILKKLIENGIERTQHNKEILKKEKSWESRVPKWRELYDDKERKGIR